jgi:hypothetical protein
LAKQELNKTAATTNKKKKKRRRRRRRRKRRKGALREQLQENNADLLFCFLGGKN